MLKQQHPQKKDFEKNPTSTEIIYSTENNRHKNRFSNNKQTSQKKDLSKLDNHKLENIDI